MSLGGYLYSGCSVQKSDFTDLTDKQWSLALHKCRVKAFLDSLERSGASWECSRQDGTIDQDDEHKGYIHILAPNSGATDDTYQGYATYFRYIEDDEPIAYYLIMTLPSWSCNPTPGESSTSHQGVDVHADNFLTKRGINGEYSSQGYTHYSVIGMYATCFHAMSLEDFGSHPKDLNYIPFKSTRLTPVGAIVTLGTSSYGYDASIRSGLNFGFSSEPSCAFGYCSKNNSPDLMSFAKSLNDAGAYWNITAMSPRAITQCVNESDTYKLVMIPCLVSNLSRDSYNPSASEATRTTLRPLQNVSQFLTIDGKLPTNVFSYNSDSTSMTTLTNNFRSTLSSHRIYNAVSLYTNNPGSTGFYNKGFINVELFANSGNDATSVYDYVSDGLYLYLGTPNTSGTYYYYYLGWDKSNPSLTSTDACKPFIPTVTFPD